MASGRLVLAAFSMLATWLDPYQPATAGDTAYLLLALYVLYALAMAVLAWRSAPLTGAVALSTHVADLSVFTVLLHLTDGPTSPYFLFFTFAMLSATLRWQWRGALWTAAAALAAHALLPLLSNQGAADGEDVLLRFVIRGGYLFVAAAMLAYLGLHQTRVREQLWRLANWQSHWTPTPTSEFEPLLCCARDVLDSPMALLAWTVAEEPWLYVATCSPSGFEYEREPPGSVDGLVDPRLEGLSFLCEDCTADSPLVYFGEQRRQRARLSPVPREFAERHRITSVLSAPLPWQAANARLFVVGRPDYSLDDLATAELLAARLAACLDQVELQRRVSESAALKERIGLARDLHDGVLQTLAATAMQVAAAQRALDNDTDSARRWLGDTNAMLLAEQKRLRDYITAARSADAAPRAAVSDELLVDLLTEFEARERRRWGIEVRWAVTPPQQRVPGEFARQLVAILGEGAANACRHGGASALVIDLRVERGRLHCRVEDDGSGFRIDRDAGKGCAQPVPRSMSERIRDLGGVLEVTSSHRGALVAFSAPLVVDGA